MRTTQYLRYQETFGNMSVEKLRAEAEKVEATRGRFADPDEPDEILVMIDRAIYLHEHGPDDNEPQI